MINPVEIVGKVVVGSSWAGYRTPAEQVVTLLTGDGTKVHLAELLGGEVGKLVGGERGARRLEVELLDELEVGHEHLASVLKLLECRVPFAVFGNPLFEKLTAKCSAGRGHEEGDC